MQKKLQALAKQSRRDVAQCLSQEKEQKAQYKVEGLINEDIHIELLEIVELYCELLLARILILNSVVDSTDLTENHIDDGINEAIRTLMYSQLYLPEIKELYQVTDLLVQKFGLDFFKTIVKDKCGVPDKVLFKCSPPMPSKSLVTLYMNEIARTYRVPYSELDKEQLKFDKDAQDKVSTFDDNIDKNMKRDSFHSVPDSESIDNTINLTQNIVDGTVIPKENKKVDEDKELEELRQRFAALHR